MSLWSTLNKSVGNVKDQATYAIMDSIIQNSAVQAVYSSVMLATNTAQVIRNEKMTLGAMGDSAAKSLGLAITGDVVAGLGGALGLVDIALVANMASALALSKVSPYLQEVWEKTLVLPNIEGVPISSNTLSTTREVDVGEQVMIVQSTTNKQYWTDNAVPKLKEWTIEGYITSALSLDQMYLIKPSLKMQMNFLDTCAASRRPVLFKDNRGEFMFVQITNLQTTEEATYNNAIKVVISLKEYKPFQVDVQQATIEAANTMRE